MPTRILSAAMATDETTETERIERALDGVNAGYVAEMQERYLADPTSVDSEWRALFEPAIGPPAETASTVGPFPPLPRPRHRFQQARRR